MVNKAAQALGKMAAGKPKNFSAAEPVVNRLA
jgi:hypothetical protein